MRLRYVFTLAKSVDPDEMQQYAAFDLGIHSLQQNSLRDFSEHKKPDKALQFSSLDFNVVAVRLKYVGLQKSSIITSCLYGLVFTRFIPEAKSVLLITNSISRICNAQTDKKILRELLCHRF